MLFWVILELASIIFIYSIQPEDEVSRKEISLIYFISQSLASSFFLVASFGMSSITKSFYLEAAQLMVLLACFALLFKIAIAPLHHWIIKMGKSLRWKPLLVILSWQKIIPIFILIKTPIGLVLSIIAILRILIGTLSQVKISSMKLILIFSSISHLGWIIFPIIFLPLVPLIYLFLYCTIFLVILLRMQIENLKSLYIQFSTSSTNETLLIILSLAGIPPLAGFFLKWISLRTILETILFSITFTLIACVRFYIYIRISLKTILSQAPQIIGQKDVKSYKKLWMVNLGLPLLLITI